MNRGVSDVLPALCLDHDDCTLVGAHATIEMLAVNWSRSGDSKRLRKQAHGRCAVASIVERRVSHGSPAHLRWQGCSGNGWRVGDARNDPYAWLQGCMHGQ